MVDLSSLFWDGASEVATKPLPTAPVPSVQSQPEDTPKDAKESTVSRLMRQSVAENGGDNLFSDHETEQRQPPKSRDNLFAAPSTDPLILGAQDRVPLEDAPDNIFVDFDVAETGEELTLITDFDLAFDQLELQYNPAQDPETGAEIPVALTISYDGDADQTRLNFNGAPVAALPGWVALEAEHVVLTTVI